MEMKHEHNHMSERCSNHGFTLIELMIALVVSLLALGAIYSTFLSQHRSYQIQSETADMQQNIRAAMYYMQREIRMAGSNPFDTLPLFGFTTAGQNSIRFTEDVAGLPTGTPSAPRPDGFVNISNVLNEDIGYRLNNGNLERQDYNTTSGWQTVAQNIDWINFVYFDGDSNAISFVSGYIPAASLSQIRSIGITIVARTGDQLLYGTQNNKSYPNYNSTASWQAPGDNRSRRRITTLINCRNLGLKDS